MMVKAAATLEVQIISNLARLKSDMDRMDRLVAEATGSASRSFGNAGKAASDYAASVQQMASKASGSAKLAGHHMQNLAFQFQDLGLQMVAAAGSSDPLKLAFMALIQQGSQIGGIMSQAGIGIKGVAAAFATMTATVAKAALTNPYIVAFAVAVGTATAAFKLFQSSVAQSGELDRFRASLGLTKEEVKQLGDVGITMGDVFRGVWRTIDEGTGLSKVFTAIKGWAVDTFQTALDYAKEAAAGTYGFFKGAYSGLAQVWRTFPAVVGEAATDAANLAIGAIETMINGAIRGVNGLIGMINSVPMLRGAGMTPFAPVTLGRMNQQYRGAGKAAIDAFVEGARSGTKEAEAALSSIGASLRRNIIGAAKDRIGAAAQALIDDRPESKAKSARENAELRKMMEWAEKSRMEAQGSLNQLEDEMIKKQRAWALEGKTLAEQQIERGKEIDANARRRYEIEEYVLDVYRQQLAVMQQLGGPARVVGGVLAGFDSGDFSGVGGKLGRLLQGVNMTVGKEGWTKVTDKLDQIFGMSNGSFARIMKDTFTAGGIGSLAGGMALGSKNSALGSFAGGAIGEKLGEKMGEKFLGQIGGFAGPLGAIAGGILGGALGGLLKKAKWGTSVVTGQGAGNVATAGNKAAYRSNAGLAGTSIQSGLDAIAAEFGAAVGAYDVSIGQYKGKWRVSSTGRAGKLKGKYSDVTDFGKDGAEDAIKFAIADAIKDGALIGLRASTQALLAASDDVEGQLKKALQFEGVFSELKSLTDPVGYAIEELDKQFAQLRDVFAEAGATSGEYAQLEQLYQRKRVDAIKEANAEADELSRNRRSLEARMLELQGRTVESVAMMRQIEVEQMQESLRPLQRRVWAMEDATAIIEQMQPYIDSLKAYRATLLGGGDTGMTYRAALVKLMGTGGLAAAGDATALGALQGAGQDFLTAAKDNARNLTQYQRDVALVARYVDGGIGAAQTQVDYAKRTLEAQDASVALLTSIDQSLTTAVGVGAITPGLIEPIVSGAQVATLVDEVKAMRAEAHAQARSIAESAAHMDRLMTRWDGDGLLVRGEADTPVYVADAP